MSLICHKNKECKEENVWICVTCNKLYCIVCIFQSNDRCKDCLLQLMHKNLQTAIKTACAVIFHDDKIINLLADYSMGIILNYCNNIIKKPSKKNNKKGKKS
eukprot:170834_1